MRETLDEADFEVHASPGDSKIVRARGLRCKLRENISAIGNIARERSLRQSVGGKLRIGETFETLSRICREPYPLRNALDIPPK